MKTIREIRIDGDIAYVPLTQGYEAVIDATDASIVCNSNWCASVKTRRDGSVRTVYAIRVRTISGHKRESRLHRLVAGTPDGLDTDHIDGDGLNNRRSNLRAVPHKENMLNQRRKSNNTSGAKGVTWCKRRKKWRALIKRGGVARSLGYHSTVDAAAAAYAAASAEMHGDLGRLE